MNKKPKQPDLEEPETGEMSVEAEAAENIPETQEVQETQKAQDNGELAELKEKYLRLAAEYDNFRKRTQREREMLFNDIKSEVLAQFLPVLDNLDRAAAAPTEDSAYAQGVAMISKQLVEVFSKQGVSEIDAGGQFDPNLHDAVMHIEDDSYEKNQIVEVFQKGYRLGDKVLRHTVVKVAN